VLVFDVPGHATLIEEQLPRPLAGQIAVEAELSLVSAGTERTMLSKAPAYPVRPGYSMVGRVTEVGPGVTGLAPGDRVMAHTGHASHAVLDRRFVLKLPDSVQSEDAAFAVVGAMAIHAVRLAGLQLGDPVLIFGQGLIGLIGTQIARIAGAMPVGVIDVVEERLALARDLGADVAVHARDRDGLDRLCRSLPGGGPAASIDLCGIPSAVDTAVAVTRRGGRVVTGSLMPGGHQVDVFGRAWMAGISIVGAYFNARPWLLDATETTSPVDWPIRLTDAGRYPGSEIATSLGDIEVFVRMLSWGRLRLQGLVDETVAAAAAPAMFMQLPHSQALGHIIRWQV
jgi:2-desacetyl-2-hydroxyethyl bacteriochlorophyllide A dehydrogenase